MIGLDTNVLVRALTDDDPEQSPLARDFMRSLTPGEPGFVSLTALVETWWVLRRDVHYRYAREQVHQVVEALLDNTAIVMENADAVRAAAATAAETGRELPDVLIATQGRRAGCTATVTFDHRATAIPGMRLLEPTTPPGDEADAAAG